MAHKHKCVALVSQQDRTNSSQTRAHAYLRLHRILGAHRSMPATLPTGLKPIRRFPRSSQRHTEGHNGGGREIVIQYHTPALSSLLQLAPRRVPFAQTDATSSMRLRRRWFYAKKQTTELNESWFVILAVSV